MKTTFQNYLTVSLLLLSFALFSQTQKVQEKYILMADESYGKEIIELPVEWAPNMTIEGFEELRFSPGWKDKESVEFWSYVLSWDVKAENPLSLNELELNLEQYFDGLMKPNHWAQVFPEPTVKLVADGTTPDAYIYSGKMRYFDGFHTGKVMATNIKATQFFCQQTGRTIVIFRISPQKHDHEVWNDLNAIKKRTDFCQGVTSESNE